MDFKSNDYISVGHFAELVGTTRSRLLFYDKKGVFSPMRIVQKKHQAPNRQYSPQQVFDYNLLQLLQDAGISLEDSTSLRRSSISEQLNRLQAHTDELEYTILRLRCMQDALRVLRLFNTIIDEHPSEHLFTLTKKRDTRLRFFPFSQEVTRNTDLFLEALAHMNRVVAETPDLLPGPFGTVYSAHRTSEHYPVKGFLVPYTLESTLTHPQDCVLPAGNYLTMWAHKEIGAWGALANQARSYMIENKLHRASHVIGWSLASDAEDGTIRLTELMTAHVIPGETAPGCLPIEPGVDDPVFP